MPSLGIEVLLTTAALPAAVASSYLAALACLARRRQPVAGMATHHFDVIVPAHNEVETIETTLESLRQLDYPSEKYRVLVIADNCTDATAERAAAAGACVLVRNDNLHRGKGYALVAAYDASARDGLADAVVVIDADTLVSPNLLRAFSARLAQGEVALQAEYGVRNPDASWRTRLMVLAFTLFHTVRSLARERLRLSSGLRGNGMCFRTTLLRRVPPAAFSIVEDVEYGIKLGLAGVRVAYVDEACVLGDMPTSGRDARSQRARWEGGRWLLMREHATALLRAVIARRDPMLLDLAADLFVPPLTTLAMLDALGCVTSIALYRQGLTGPVAPILWVVSLAGTAAYIARGMALAGGGWRLASALAAAPLYALWKLTLITWPGTSRSAWIRTRRLHDMPPVQR